jgi:ATP-dependent Clp protease ATP-binding subunit ClpX
MDGVELEIRPSALGAIARKGLGAQDRRPGLRSIMEQSLIDTMFELPTLDGVAKVVLDEHTIQDEAKPLLVYREHKASA